MDPLFIIGTERSGSNLLRVILNSHDRIDVPHPPHLMRYFGGVEAGYGDLADPERFRTMVQDMARLIATHIYPWDFPIDVERVVADAEPRSAFGATAAIYDQHLERSGKARWGCKSTFMVHYTQQVFERYPEARLLYLVRDPRDVAVSSRKSVFSPCHPFHTAQLWAHQQALGLAALDALPERKILLLRYEDLTAEPERHVRAVCDFLGEDFQDGMLRFFETKAAKKGAGLSESWGNTARPILKNNSKFRTELTPGEIALVEAAAAVPMERLGYAPVSAPDAIAAAAPGAARRLAYRLQEARLRAGIELRSMRRDENHWRRWRRDATARWVELRRGGGS